MRSRSFLARTVAALLVASAALAAEPLNVRPGLWDMTSTITMSGAPLYVEGMPASGQASYAQQWAKQVGKPITSRDQQCVTPEEIKKLDLFRGLEQEGKACKHTVARSTATAVAAVSECKDAKITTKTEIEFAATSPQAMTGTIKSTMTSPNGTTVMTMATNGKWVGASCPDEDEEEEDSGD